MKSFTRICKAIFYVLIRDSVLYRYLHYRRRYPGLAVSSKANLSVNGTFDFVRGVSIGEGAKLIVESTGKLSMEKGAYVGRHVEIATNDCLRIGADSSIQDFSVVVGRVDIGTNCLISYAVMITSGAHYHRLKPRWLIRDQDEFVRNSHGLSADHHKAIVIEDDCWIGAHSVLMPGIRVSKGSVIGANAVVNQDVPPYSIVAGVPSKVVGKRFDFVPPSQIESTNPDDLPYFYAGFSVRQMELKRTADLGGIATGSRFTLALAKPGARVVTLRVRTLVAGDVSLSFGNQTIPIGSEFTSIEFALPAKVDDRLQFKVTSPVKAGEIMALASAELKI